MNGEENAWTSEDQVITEAFELVNEQINKSVKINELTKSQQNEWKVVN